MVISASLYNALGQWRSRRGDFPCGGGHGCAGAGHGGSDRLCHLVQRADGPRAGQPRQRQLTVKRLACDGSFAAGTISRHCRVDLDDLGALDGPWRCDAGVGNCECDVMLGAESVPNHLIFYWSGESGTGPCELIWPLPLIVLPAPQQQAAE